VDRHPVLKVNAAQSSTAPPIVMITHHVEEIPVGFTHVLLLRDGRVVAAGPIVETLTGRRSY